MKEGTNHFSDFFADGQAPTVEDRDRSFVGVRSVKRSLLAELQSGADGSPRHPEDLLARWPTDPRQDRDAASLLFEDFQQRSRRGESPSREDYDERFPEHKDSLAALFRKQDVLESISEGSSASGLTLALPVVGEELFGFRLRQALGEGAFARVYLAEQADLAGRPVVVKVSNTDGDEPQTLAQMQHTNIVPIYSVHEDAKAGLRAVCMPYFGGASLSRVLEHMWKEGEPPALGRQFVEALAAVGGPTAIPTAGTGQEPASATTASEQGSLALLQRLDYVRACIWFTAQLADGLQHAHERGVYHRDIKPSNILLGADGQPMLLDFNLAHHVSGPKAHASATLGGTIAYMAPEHLRALATRDPALVPFVDQRSDVYALGMVLFEMLAGQGPFQQSASYAPLPFVIQAMALERSKLAPSLRQQRPESPWGLESVLRKCLAPNQGDRYQKAADLAEDLRRFLDDLPLKHAPELSQAERVQKWLRRHPQLTSVGSIVTAAVALLIFTGAALVGVRNHLTRTQEELEATQSRERKQDFDRLTTRAKCLVNVSSDFQDNLPAGLNVLENVLGLYGVLERADWQEHPAWRRLAPEEQRQMAEDTRELLLLLAWARTRAASGAVEVLHEALGLLDRAEAIQGLSPSPALFRDRSHYLKQLGESDKALAAAEQADQLKPVTPRDHYLLATAYIRSSASDRHPRALHELDRAVQLTPGRPDYWVHMQRGICLLDLGKYDLAAADFGVCVGTWPEFAWGHFNRGLALDLLGRKEQAVASYSAALELDRTFVDAWWNRGVAHLELRRWREALDDCCQAAALGRDDAALHLALGKAHEKLGQPAEADQAFAAMLERLPSAPEARSLVLCEYGFSVVRRLPGRAREVFQEVLAAAPKHQFALYGLGMAAVEAGQIERAIDHFSLTLHHYPNYLDARTCRAVLFARLGNIGEARSEIERCLHQDRVRSATHYDAACVTALASRHMDSQDQSRCKEAAVAHLQWAFDRGFGREQARNDPDLAALRGFEKFEQLLK